MKMRLLLTTVLCLVCLVTCWAVVVQHQELTRLETRERELVAQASRENAEPAPVTSEPGATSPPEVPATTPVPPELLRLRNEITQLNRRARELAGVRAENQRLMAQIATRQAATGPVLPAGYIRKSQAQRAGYNTPDDAFQTFLWALANKDLNSLYESLVPESVQQLKAMVESSGADQFFEHTPDIPGAAITGRQTLPDGSVQLMIQVVPEAAPMPMAARQINGQWKISMPH